MARRLFGPRPSVIYFTRIYFTRSKLIQHIYAAHQLIGKKLHSLVDKVKSIVTIYVSCLMLAFHLCTWHKSNIIFCIGGCLFHGILMLWIKLKKSISFLCLVFGELLFFLRFRHRIKIALLGNMLHIERCNIDIFCTIQINTCKTIIAGAASLFPSSNQGFSSEDCGGVEGNKKVLHENTPLHARTARTDWNKEAG